MGVLVRQGVLLWEGADLIWAGSWYALMGEPTALCRIGNRTSLWESSRNLKGSVFILTVVAWAEWGAKFVHSDAVIPEFSGVSVVIAFNFKNEVILGVISEVKESIEWSKGSNGECFRSVDSKLGLGEAEEHHAC